MSTQKNLTCQKKRLLILLRKFQIFLSYRGRKVPSCSTFLFSIHFKILPDLCNSSFAFTSTKQLQINCTIVHFLTADFYKTISTIPHCCFWTIFRDIFLGLQQIHSRALKYFQGCHKYIPMLWNISGLQQIHSNAFKYFQGCYKCLFCLKISAKCVCTPEEKVTAQMSPKTIHVETKIVKTWQQLQICKIVFLRSPSASLHTPTSSQFANTWKVAPFWQTSPLLPVKIWKKKKQNTRAQKIFCK